MKSLALIFITAHRRVTRWLIPTLLAPLLLACGAESAPEGGVTDEAHTTPIAAPAETLVASVLEDDAEEDAAPLPIARDIPTLKRFGVMPHFDDIDTMVERRVIRILTVYGPGRYFLENGPQGIVQEYAQKLQKMDN
ncbi:MAG: hypothetical protein VW806_06920 [Halieaceae bacterium]